MYRILCWADFALGAILIAVSVAALSLTRDLDGGTASVMGPGYVPRMLALLLILIGAGIIARSFVVAGTVSLRCRIRPLLLIAAGVAIFGLAAERLGIIVTIFTMVMLSTWAYPTTRWLEAGSLALGVAIFSALLFVVALGLPIPIWPAALVQ